MHIILGVKCCFISEMTMIKLSSMKHVPDTKVYILKTGKKILIEKRTYLIFIFGLNVGVPPWIHSAGEILPA